MMMVSKPNLERTIRYSIESEEEEEEEEKRRKGNWKNGQRSARYSLSLMSLD